MPAEVTLIDVVLLLLLLAVVKSLKSYRRKEYCLKDLTLAVTLGIGDISWARPM